ncbi:MAG: N-6 DNA methylase, partial [Ktedonobacteraceae bacterium]
MPEELTPAVLNKAVGRYYKELQDYESQADHELALRPAFQNLLAEMARKRSLTLVHEMTIRGRIRPDGVLCNEYHIRLGYWEAKGPKGNLEDEIAAKIHAGYPLDNALFENTRLAVLYQAGKRYDFNMKVMADVTAMLRQFLTYQKPDVANFEHAVLDFKEQIPNIATKLLVLINDEYKSNGKFLAAFNTFAALCQSTLNPHIGADEIKEMLVQHLLTERLFRTVFNNPDFVHNNVIAVEIERVIQALTSRSFNRREFLRALDPFYNAIEGAARGIETWSERQHFLNTVYERFFQGFAIKKADTHGIVYTPQEIVDFMVASVDEVLQREFGKSLATPGVKILDPATGTGNFIVNIIKHIPRGALQEKYAHDLFCNEIMLLPYYIAALNIEHEYYDKMGTYVPFEGVCFADTLELAEGQQLTLFAEENTERVQREKDANIMVVIGNPPYNVGQVNENDNNKNRKYALVDQRIRETYAKASKASNKNALSDAYVKFFRWAADRLQGRDGIVCMVTNNSFVDQIAFDGMRQHMLKDFTHIYHLDLHGNVRKNPKISGTKHNVFGIQVGVGITIAVRSAKHVSPEIYYYRVPEEWTKREKLLFLQKQGKLTNVDWLQLSPDPNYTWITEGLRPEFTTFIAMGS